MEKRYVYLVIVNVGFYSEPDDEVKKVFDNYESALKYLNRVKNRYRGSSIKKFEVFH